MKKLTVLFSLLCFSGIKLAAATPSSASLSVIPRLEVMTAATEKPVHSYSGSALYTMFEGSASEHFDWLLVNNWLNGSNFQDKEWWQYKYAGHSDYSNFIYYALLNFHFNSWTVSVGKDVFHTVGIMGDEWDWDLSSPFTSGAWNNIQAYQWGGSVAWTTPSEMTTLKLQISSSPWGEKPFASNLWTYSAKWTGEYGWFSNIWNYSAVQRADRKFDHIFSLGQKAEFGKFNVILDYTNVLDELVCDTDEEGEEYETGYKLGYSFSGVFGYAPTESIDLSIRGMKASDRWYAGAQAYFKPLKNKDLFRIHVLGGYDSYFETAVFNVGVTFNIGINLWGNK